MSISARVRQLVYERDGNACVACGVAHGLTIQHRKNRGMGGSKLLDSPANLVTMCAVENMLLESNADFADRGRRNGWKLWSYLDPLRCPVLYPDGLFGLDDSGGRYPWVGEVPVMF